MVSYSRPDTLDVHLKRETVDGKCPNCNESSLAKYPVLSEGGWWSVTKCQKCLHSVSREKGPLFGTYEPQGAPK